MKTKKKLIIFLGVIIILIILLAYFLNYRSKDSYQFKGNTLYYSENRGKTDYEILSKSLNDSLEIYKIRFKSKNFLDNPTIIYGLLFFSKDKKNVPGLVLLPGGGGTKEQESPLAIKIVKMGYAVLTIDQRGIGETGGVYLNFEQDYQVFSQGKEPIQHLSVYDALKAYDVLRTIKNVDRSNVGIAGESMGGRYAIITAAIDKRLKGVIVISSSGFHVKNENLPYTPYLLSIDPDHYIGKISPNQIFMLHSSNDSVISLHDAQFTFDLAKEPKKFYVTDGCTHGYCDLMYDELKQDLKSMFGK